MKMYHVLVCILLFFVLNPTSSSSSVIQLVTIEDIHIPKNGQIIKSPLQYPQQNVDWIWKLKQNVQVEVMGFGINGKQGDFLFISPYPFPLSPGKDIPIDQIISNVPIGKNSFLSWTTKPSTKIQIISAQGHFIYFHGTARTTIGFTGINQQEIGFQLNITPIAFGDDIIPPTTEGPVTDPPGQTMDDFVTKFISGKLPNEFLLELDSFQSIVSQMTEQYLQNQSIQPKNPILPRDVHIPLEHLRFCDRSWTSYKRCVEVMFAIVTYDMDGTYLMTKSRINEMWSLYGDELIRKGYIPLDPPKQGHSTQGWIWVTACLITLLLISLLLGFTWLQKTRQFKHNAEVHGAIIEVTDQGTFYDRQNPMHQIRKSMINGRMKKKSSNFWKTEHHHHGHEPSGHGHDESFDLPPIMSTSYHVNELYVPDDDEQDEINEYLRLPQNNS